MEILTLLMAVAIVVFAVKSRQQALRVALLGRSLGKYQIERLMENLTEGYLRALGEDDPDRRAQIWRLMDSVASELVAQFSQFVSEFSRVAETRTRVSRFAVAVPYAHRLFPRASFDVRKVLAVHAHGIAHAAQNSEQRTPRDKAFTLSAELFLMQHTCHWFCRSRMVASARMWARHKTSHAQLVASVAPETRKAYCTLTGVGV